MLFARKMMAAEKAKELKLLRSERLGVEGDKRLDDQIATEKAMIRAAQESEKSKKIKSWVKKRRSEIKSKRKRSKGVLGKPHVFGDGGSSAQEYFIGTGKRRKKDF